MSEPRDMYDLQGNKLLANYGPRMPDPSGEWRIVELSKDAFKAYKQIKRGLLATMGGRQAQGRTFTISEHYWRDQLGLHMSSGWIHMGNAQKEPQMMLFHLPKAVTQAQAQAKAAAAKPAVPVVAPAPGQGANNNQNNLQNQKQNQSNSKNNANVKRPPEPGGGAGGNKRPRKG
ncbi:unnamed protein product [Vitrella brassicaformis CCMP3155]|uniref:Cyclin-dependent kinases regulatory subunit n=1 Tax=Vitrella brassicaformis (strain CCMP3155) TaxID=1169540 RepID=A0A0G4FGP4_VITBC|nr:unnamed protein product [Vitrella brassicaformis CCMP3155]|eukprot:CEM12664.1 unnamed protein product [Vitrella brassicaformis CCMP3155]